MASQDAEETFAKLQSSIQSALLATTRTTNAIVAQDLPFLRSLDPSTAAVLDAQHARLLSLAERLLANAAAGTAIANPKLTDADALESSWTGVVDVLDGLLERADTCLDSHEAQRARGEVQHDTQAGQFQSQAEVPTSTNGTNSSPKKTFEKVPRNLDIPKPQKQFETPLNLLNKDQKVFRPLLSHKPFATKSYEESLSLRVPASSYGLEEQVAHPYQLEIEEYQFPDFVHEKAEPIPYLDFESTTATYVDTPEALDEMLSELRNATEIAVDLEHHDLRSYIGIVSLMQISTRTRDWIIDTLKPWRRRLECLNEVFANPGIVKVFQGSHSDIIWLQRDLGLYIVGLFDTHHACKALRYPGASLAFLLNKFCDFQAQKQFQMADWRIRPLPQVMFDYARSDTHFLLYIYDNMRNELVDASSGLPAEDNLVTWVQERSKEECLQRYELPVYDRVSGLSMNGWYRLLARTPALFSKEQFSVYRAVHAWRDAVARAEDESVVYVMANHTLLTLAREMPTDRVVLFRVAAPVSQPVRLRVDELVAVIQKAKEDAAHGPEMREIMSKIDEIDASRRKRWHQPAPVSKKEVAQDLETTVDESSSKAVAQIVAHTLPRSQLWGDVNMSLPDRSLQISTNIELALPLPDLTAEIFEPGSRTVGPSAQLPEDATYIAKEDRTVVDSADDVFVVKQLGGRTKQKRKHRESDTSTTELSNVTITNGGNRIPNRAEDSRKARERNQARRDERKAARLAAQEAAKAAKASADAAVIVDQDGGVPLDYASQPSLLTGLQKEKTGKYKKPKKGQGPFDMYSKAADAPKGLGRSQKEKGGKQATFSQ